MIGAKQDAHGDKVATYSLGLLMLLVVSLQTNETINIRILTIRIIFVCRRILRAIIGNLLIARHARFLLMFVAQRLSSFCQRWCYDVN